VSTFGRRLERLEARVAPPIAEPMSPERFEALMHKLEAVGLAAWSDEWQRWYPPQPQVLRELLRERAGRGR
jgi:hypothetical protein